MCLRSHGKADAVAYLQWMIDDAWQIGWEFHIML